jgi:hypothetical protein
VSQVAPAQWIHLQAFEKPCNKTPTEGPSNKSSGYIKTQARMNLTALEGIANIL